MGKRSNIIVACVGITAALTLMSAAATMAFSKQSSLRGYSEKHEEVFQSRKAKDILPFSDILKAVRPHIQGEIIETEFEIEDGRPVYEFKYIDPSGRVIEIYVDAKTGKILKKEFD